MIKSIYMTQFTREQVEGKKNPSRDMANHKAGQKHQRKLLWEARMAREKLERKVKDGLV